MFLFFSAFWEQVGADEAAVVDKLAHIAVGTGFGIAVIAVIDADLAACFVDSIGDGMQSRAEIVQRVLGTGIYPEADYAEGGAGGVIVKMVSIGIILVADAVGIKESAEFFGVGAEHCGVKQKGELIDLELADELGEVLRHMQQFHDVIDGDYLAAAMVHIVFAVAH